MGEYGGSGDVEIAGGNQQKVQYNQNSDSSYVNDDYLQNNL